MIIGKDQEPGTSNSNNKPGTSKPRKGNMKLRCQICSRLLAGLSSLKRHMKNIHTATPTGYQCPICSKMNNRIDNYQKHMRNIHGYGVETPAPTITTYCPKATAQAPVIKRPWEVTPILPGEVPVFTVRSKPYPDTSNHDKYKKEGTTTTSTVEPSSPERLPPLSSPSGLEEDLYLSPSSSSCSSSSSTSSCSTSSSSSSNTNSSNSSSSCSSSSSFSSTNSTNSDFSNTSVKFLKEQFYYDSNSCNSHISIPSATCSTSTIDFTSNIPLPDEPSLDEWLILDEWSDNSIVPFECE